MLPTDEIVLWGSAARMPGATSATLAVILPLRLDPPPPNAPVAYEELEGEEEEAEEEENAEEEEEVEREEEEEEVDEEELVLVLVKAAAEADPACDRVPTTPCLACNAPCSPWTARGPCVGRPCVA